MNGWKRLLAVVAGVVGLAGTMSCAEEFRGKPPLQGEVRFPIGLAVDTDRDTLLVANSNFDLTYSGASVVAVDVGTHAFRDAFVAMGSFPGELTLVNSAEHSAAFVYMAVRGDNTLTWFKTGTESGDYALWCNDEQDSSLPECSGSHVVVDGVVPLEVDDVWSDTDVTMGTDPLAVAVLPGRKGEPDRLVVAALKSGTVSLMEVGQAGAPVIVAQYAASQGVNGIAVEPVGRKIFLTSKYNAVVYRLSVEEGESGPTLGLERVIPLPGIIQAADFGRGIAVAGGGRYLLVSYRAPASLLVLDAGAADGSYEQEAVRMVPLGRQPGTVRVFPSGPGGREVAYVACFGDDVVWAVDMDTLLPSAEIAVGKGPYDMAVLLKDDVKRLYVSNFLGHTVSVIELDPGSPYFNRQIAEIH
jgi:hypothetical protein